VREHRRDGMSGDSRVVFGPQHVKVETYATDLDDVVGSRFQSCQLVEVSVVVRDVETVDPGARKDDQVNKRDSDA